MVGVCLPVCSHLAVLMLSEKREEEEEQEQEQEEGAVLAGGSKRGKMFQVTQQAVNLLLSRKLLKIMGLKKHDWRKGVFKSYPPQVKYVVRDQKPQSSEHTVSTTVRM